MNSRNALRVLFVAFIGLGLFYLSLRPSAAEQKMGRLANDAGPGSRVLAPVDASPPTSGSPGLGVTVVSSGTLTNTLYLPLVARRYCQPFVYDETIRYNLDKIDAPESWHCWGLGQGVVVAVLDTGVDLDHPDLQANIVPGATFVAGTSTPDDDHGHGSHVAGIAAGVADNGGIIGVSPNASIMPVKVLDSYGSGYLSDIANGIIWAVDHGARVINMSLGGTSSHPTLESAVNYAHSSGVLIVAAAGNCGGANFYDNGCSYQDQPNYPAALSNVVAVASTDSSDAQSYFSNQGAYVEIAAPGSSIYSSYAYGGYATVGGTSQATPHVAGLAALIWSIDPGLTNEQVRTKINNTAVDLGSAGWDIQFGYGRIDAAAAVSSTTVLALESAAGPASSVAEPLPLSRESDLEIVPGVVLVKFRSGISTQTAGPILTSLGREVQFTASIPQIGLSKLSVPVGTEWDVIEALQALSQVEYAEPDLLFHTW